MIIYLTVIAVQPSTDHGGWSADPNGRRLWGVFAGEIGGGNGLEALVLGARLGLPVVDIDLMGRAFPELQVGPM